MWDSDPFAYGVKFNASILLLCGIRLNLCMSDFSIRFTDHICATNTLEFFRRIYHFRYILNIGRQIHETILAERFNFFRVSVD